MKSIQSAKKIDVKQYDEKICAYSKCNKKFFRRKCSSTSHCPLPVGIRGKNCVTCCSVCSKLHGNEIKCKKTDE